MPPPSAKASVKRRATVQSGRQIDNCELSRKSKAVPTARRSIFLEGHGIGRRGAIAFQLEACNSGRERGRRVPGPNTAPALRTLPQRGRIRRAIASRSRLSSNADLYGSDMHGSRRITPHASPLRNPDAIALECRQGSATVSRCKTAPHFRPLSVLAMHSPQVTACSGAAAGLNLRQPRNTVPL